jgi:ligand-binding SRPBCC domain-containing protein
MTQFVKESLIHASPELVFAFHEQPDVLKQLTPPWEKSAIIQQARISDVGSRAIIEAVVLGPWKVRWIAEHTLYEPPHMFEDVLIAGPFRSWRHLHIVKADIGGAILRDEIEFETPLWFFDRIIAPLVIEPRLQRLFNFRHEVTRRWCEGGERPSA